MGRPKVPLISKRAVLEIALDIVDNEGFDNLSIRRIADELGVNGASLYHHFANKDEIVVGAAELALSRTPVNLPAGSPEDWRVWIIAATASLRDVLTAHPGFVPVFIRMRAAGMGSDLLDAAAERLLEADVPLGLIAPMYEALERLVIGTVLRDEATQHIYATVDRVQHPTLAKAVSSVEIPSRAMFEILAMGMLKELEAWHDKRTRKVKGRGRAAGSAVRLAEASNDGASKRRQPSADGVTSKTVNSARRSSAAGKSAGTQTPRAAPRKTS